jgi:hypothetical protein
MRPGKRPVIYWDTCILLAWIKDETRQDDQMQGLIQVAQGVTRNKIDLITSVISRVEIFESTLTEGQKQRYVDLFKRSNCIQLGVTGPVADRASRLRHESRQQSRSGNQVLLSVPDAVHLASAILHKAAEFHTFDGVRDDKRSVKLIPLSGKPLVEGLTICVPHVKQPDMFPGA